jgi:hypothetical protein
VYVCALAIGSDSSSNTVAKRRSIFSFGEN